MFVVFLSNSICRDLFPRISKISQRSSFLISCSQLPKTFNRIWKSPRELVLMRNEFNVSSVESNFETTGERRDARYLFVQNVSLLTLKVKSFFRKLK